MGILKDLLDNYFEVYIDNINDGEVFIVKVYRDGELLKYILDRDYAVDYMGLVKDNPEIKYTCY